MLLCVSQLRPAVAQAGSFNFFLFFSFFLSFERNSFLVVGESCEEQDLGAPGLTALGCPCFSAFSALSVFLKAQTLHSAQTKASNSQPCQPCSSPASRPLRPSSVLSSHMGLLTVLEVLRVCSHLRAFVLAVLCLECPSLRFFPQLGPSADLVLGPGPSLRDFSASLHLK